MVYLRIIFTILSAICIAALIPMGALLGWAWVGYCFFGALAFFALMLLCKQTQEINELRAQRERNVESNELSDTEKIPTEEKAQTTKFDEAKK